MRLAGDGAAVVIHDATLERTALRPGLVESMTSAELQDVDAGSWFNLRRPALARDLFRRERIPLLSTVFERFGARARLLYVELKTEDATLRAPLAREVVRLIKEHGLEGSAVVKSFEHDTILEVKRADERVRTAALFHRGWRRPVVPVKQILARASACRADEISLHVLLLSRRVVEAAHEKGFQVITWTADSPFWLRRARALALRAVITNRPADLRAALQSL